MTSGCKHAILRRAVESDVPQPHDFFEVNLADNASHKARRNEDRTDWTGVQTQYSEKWSLFWSVAALKTVVYPFHFISFLTHQSSVAGTRLARALYALPRVRSSKTDANRMEGVRPIGTRYENPFILGLLLD